VAERKVEIRVSVDDLDAARKLDALSVKLDKLIAKFRLLGKVTSGPAINVDGITKANAELDKLDARLNAIGRKRVTANVNVDVNGVKGAVAARVARDAAHNGRFASLFGPTVPFFKSMAGKSGWASLLGLFGSGGAAGAAGGGGGAAAAGGGGFSWASLAASPAGIAGILAGAPSIAALIDALVGQGAGSATALGSLMLTNKFAPKTLKRGSSSIMDTLKTVTQSFAPSVGMMFSDFGTSFATLAPMLAKLFGASLPFLQQFFTLAMAIARTVLPALTLVMKQMVSSGALQAMTQGFVFIIQGIAGMIAAMGPGFKAGSEVFRAIAMGIRGILYGLGDAFGFLGKVAGIEYHAIHDWWDKLRHNTAVIFDGMRHEVAHIWDIIYNDVIGKVVHIYRDVDTWEQKMRHETAVIFDGIRHDIAHYWDVIWQYTIGSVQKGIGDVVTFFRGLPGKIMGGLAGLGSTLWSWAKNLLQMIVNGAKSMAGSVLGWFRNLGSGILHAVGSLFHFGSPSKTMFQYGKWIVQGLERGMQSRIPHITGVAGSVAGIITQVLRMSGKPMSWVPALARLVQLESGGNRYAVNPISVMGEHATGMWQMLPSTFYSYGGRGSLFNPVVEGLAALRYISATYGSPFNIPGLFSGGYRGYAKGGWINEPVLGMGLHSGIKYAFGENAPAIPEYVGPGGGGNIYITVQGDTNPDAAAFRIWQQLRHYRTTHGNIPLKLG
jgi:hypothetical protein